MKSKVLLVEGKFPQCDMRWNLSSTSSIVQESWKIRAMTPILHPTHSPGCEEFLDEVLARMGGRSFSMKSRNRAIVEYLPHVAGGMRASSNRSMLRG